MRNEVINAILKGDIEALKAMKPAIDKKAEIERFIKPYTNKEGKGHIPVDAWVKDR